MDPERFKNVSEGVKNIVLTIAVLVGGIWTLYTFKSLGQEQEARTRVTKLEAEVAVAKAQQQKAELETGDFPLAIDINARVVKRAIHVDAVLRNSGAGPLELRFRAPAFHLARLQKSANGRKAAIVAEGRALYLSKAGALELSDRRLLGQQTRHVAYVFDVAEPGDYLVQVNVNYRDEDMRDPGTEAFEQALVRVE